MDKPTDSALAYAAREIEASISQLRNPDGETIRNYPEKVNGLVNRLGRLQELVFKRYLMDMSVAVDSLTMNQIIDTVKRTAQLSVEAEQSCRKLKRLRDREMHTDPDTHSSLTYLESMHNLLVSFLRDRLDLNLNASVVADRSVRLPSFDAFSFVHREEELGLLHNLLLGEDPVSTVAIVGAPAVGKSEIALCFAHAAEAHFSDGAVWVKAAGLSSDMIMHRLLDTLDTALGSRAGAKSAWAIWDQYISDKRMLIIIDNADDLDVSELRPIGRNCRTILTMRNRYLAQNALRLPPNAIIELPGLDERESMHLLTRRLMRTIDESDVIPAGQIIQVLQGLPLALCLAADLLNQTENLSLANYASLLQQSPLEYLDSYPGRGIRSAFDTSLRYIEQVGPELKSVFASLGVCSPGGFSLDTACAITTHASDEMKIALSRLISLSLLRTDKERYYFHPLVREFAQDLAKKSELFEEAQTRYVECLVDLVARHPATDPSFMSLLEPDFEAILGAAQWLLGQPDTDLRVWREFWRNIRDILETRAYYDEAITLMETALELTRRLSLDAVGDSSLLADARELEAYYAAQLGKFYGRAWRSGDAIETLNHALSLETDPERILKVRNSLALAKRRNRDHQGALEVLRKSLDSEETQSDESRAFLLNVYGRALLTQGRATEALSHLEEALSIEQAPPNDLRSKAITLSEMGRAFRKLRRYDESVRCFEESLTLSTNYDNNPRTLSINHNEIADSLCMDGRHTEAIKHSIKALEFSNSLSDPRSRTIARQRFASVLRKTSARSKALQRDREWAEALPVTEAWLDGEQALEFGRGQFWALVDLGNINVSLGMPDDALKAYTRALEDAATRGDVFSESVACQAKAKLLQRSRRWEEALPYAETWANCQHKLDCPEQEFWALIDLGSISDNLGKPDDALAAYSRALDNARLRGVPREQMIATERFVRGLKKQGKWEEALPLAEAWVAGEQELGFYSEEFRALMDLGHIYYNVGRLEEALEAYSMALDNAQRRRDDSDESNARTLRDQVTRRLNSAQMRISKEEELAGLTPAEIRHVSDRDDQSTCRVLSTKISLFTALGRHQMATRAAESMAARLPDCAGVKEQMRRCKGDWSRAGNLRVGLRRRVKRVLVNQGYGFLHPDPSSETTDIYFHSSVVEGDICNLRPGLEVLVDYYVCKDRRLAANRVVPLQGSAQQHARV